MLYWQRKQSFLREHCARFSPFECTSHNKWDKASSGTLWSAWFRSPNKPYARSLPLWFICPSHWGPADSWMPPRDAKKNAKENPFFKMWQNDRTHPLFSCQNQTGAESILERISRIPVWSYFKAGTLLSCFKQKETGLTIDLKDDWNDVWSRSLGLRL